jgi:hypothetical protein
VKVIDVLGFLTPPFLAIGLAGLATFRLFAVTLAAFVTMVGNE